MSLGRLITAMATPMTTAGEVDFPRARELVRWLIDRGSDGIVVAGSTGESATLSTEERLHLFEAVNDEAGGRVSVIANTGTNDTAQSVRLTQQAEAVGVDAVMAVVPYYNKPPAAGLKNHFAAIAEATRLPVMVYNVPGRTGMNMTAATTLELAAIPNIAAVKEASGNMEQIAAICAGKPDDFVLYSGDDALTLPVLGVGGYGVVSVASHVAGPQIKDMIAAVCCGDQQTALRIHQRLLPLFAALFVTSNPIPLKKAMELCGFFIGSPRLPLIAADSGQTAVIKAALAQISR